LRVGRQDRLVGQVGACERVAHPVESGLPAALVEAAELLGQERLDPRGHGVGHLLELALEAAPLP
jgi:hypothetical protein